MADYANLEKKIANRRTSNIAIEKIESGTEIITVYEILDEIMVQNGNQFLLLENNISILFLKF